MEVGPAHTAACGLAVKDSDQWILIQFILEAVIMEPDKSATRVDPAGMRSVASTLPFQQTLAKLEQILKDRKQQVFAKIDHAANAAQTGMVLRPTVVLLFGNPQVGTPLMQSRQTIGIDLPLKVLAWEDESGVAWLSYNDPAWLVERHGIKDRQETLAAIQGAWRGSSNSRRPKALQRGKIEPSLRGVTPIGGGWLTHPSRISRNRLRQASRCIRETATIRRLHPTRPGKAW